MCLNSKVGTSQLESVFKSSRNPLPIDNTVISKLEFNLVRAQSIDFETQFYPKDRGW